MALIPGTNIDDPTLDDDPCGLCRMLVKARQALISGEKESAFSYLANGVTRSMNFSIANLAKLEHEIAVQRAACIALQTGIAARPARHAIQFGSQRRGVAPYHGGGRPQVVLIQGPPPVPVVTANPSTVTIKSNDGTVLAVVEADESD